MKTNIKLILLLIFSNLGYSQIYYSHYLDETSEWKSIEHDGSANNHSCTFSTMYFDGFQNISGYTYYKMYRTYYHIVYDIDFSILYPQSGNYTNFMGYLREDSNGNLYINYDGTNDILYFNNQTIINSQIGDLSIGQYGQSDCSIDFIDFIANNGLNLKRTKSDTALYSEGIWQAVEGVGYINDSCNVLSMADYSFFYFYRMYYYSKQGQIINFFNRVYPPQGSGLTTNTMVYSFPPADHQSLHTFNFTKSTIQLFPNPTTTFITIDNNIERINTIKITDIQGRVLQTRAINDTKAQLDLSNYQSGTYFIEIKTETGVEVKKIVKQ